MTTDADDVAAFVRARLDEDEAIARTADPGPWEVGPNPARKGMVYIREEGDLLDSVGLTWREPVFVSQVPNKTRFRENAAFIAAHDPARVLREVAAKRVILARWEFAANQVAVGAVNEGAGYGPADPGWPLRADSHELDLRSLAAVWSDHPAYRREWEP